MKQNHKKAILIFVIGASAATVSAQSKEQIINSYNNAFNARDVEGFLEPLDDSVKTFKFPNTLVENGKPKVRESYTPAFKSKELGGQIEILGRVEIGDVYIIEQSLRRSGFPSVDQYVIFKFKGNKIIETHYLPKNFSWEKHPFDR